MYRVPLGCNVSLPIHLLSSASFVLTVTGLSASNFVVKVGNMTDTTLQILSGQDGYTGSNAFEVYELKDGEGSGQGMYWIHIGHKGIFDEAGIYFLEIRANADGDQGDPYPISAAVEVYEQDATSYTYECQEVATPIILSNYDTTGTLMFYGRPAFDNTTYIDVTYDNFTGQANVILTKGKVYWIKVTSGDVEKAYRIMGGQNTQIDWEDNNAPIWTGT